MNTNIADNNFDMQLAIEKALDQKLNLVVELEKLRRMEYLSVDEVAKLFSLEKNTLNTQRSRGVGPPYVKLGSKVLYSREAVRAYLQEHTIKTLPHM